MLSDLTWTYIGLAQPIVDVPIPDLAWNGMAGLKDPLHLFVSEENPVFGLLFSVCSIATLVSFVVSQALGSFLIIDGLWSILPVVYSGIVLAHYPDNPRVWAATGVIIAWGTRLTWSSWRKGMFSKEGGEDYRWRVMRERYGWWRMLALNVVFASPVQHGILLGITLPVLVAGQEPFYGVTLLDVAGMIGAVGFLGMEVVADAQQWSFQERKRRSRTADAETKDGFCRSGLWRYSRHPNFFSEQSIWVSMSLFAVAATGTWGSWWDVGCWALVALFQGSTMLTEEISGGKYPGYAAYQRETSRLFPWWRSAGKKGHVE